VRCLRASGKQNSHGYSDFATSIRILPISIALAHPHVILDGIRLKGEQS
jgi:hypothetical protein